MPYKQSKLTKFRGFKRRYKKRLPFSRKQASAIKKIALKSGEKKVFEMAQTTPSLTNASPVKIDIATNFRVAQGDDDGQRDGNQITMKNLKLKLQLLGPTSSNLYRLYVIQWLDKSEPSGITNIQAHDFLPRLESADRPYQVLMDRTFKYFSEGIAQYQIHNVNVPMGKLKIKRLSYEDSDTLGSLITKGNIAVYMTSVSGVSTSTTINGRLSYYDN